MEENQNKGCARGCLVFGLAAVALVALVNFLLSISGGKDTPKPAATSAPAATASAHIYDNAEIITLMSGSGTEVVGKCSVIKASSSDVTDEALADWYFNHVEPGEYNYAIIAYTDKLNIGVYGNKGIVEKDVGLHPEEDGSYSVGSNDDAVIYFAADGKLTKMADDDADDSDISIDECLQKLDAAIEENFSSLDGSTVNVSKDGTDVTISISATGIANDAVAALAGNSDAVTGWNNLVDSMKTLSRNSQDFLNDFGFDEYNTMVQVINDLDNTKVLLAVTHEVVIFDAVNGIGT